jgi:hypothetical protein
LDLRGRKWYNKELRNLYDSSNIIRGDQIKEDEMGSTCSTHGSYEKCIQYFSWKACKRKGDSRDLCVDGRIILEWIFGKYGGKLCKGFIWHSIGTRGGLL